MTDSPPLVVVQDAFVTRGSGVLVEPRITFDGTTGEFPIVLRLPNGEERSAVGVFETSHIRGGNAPFALLRVLAVKPEDVPAGTVILKG